jgi:putative ABC transport system permease protein
MIHIQFIIRQLSRSSKQAVVFILCIILSLSTLTAFTGFSKSVNRSLLDDARKLHAADIIIRTYDKISNGLEKAVAEQVRLGRVELTRFYEFNSVVRAPDTQKSLLSRLKVVEKGYPFYGEVVLRSGLSFHGLLTPGHVVVEKTLLDRLGLSVGDPIKVGFTTLTIKDVVLSEPDRPMNFFSFGPRVFISIQDLDALGLLQTGSRIRTVYLLKSKDDAQTDALANLFKQAAVMGQEQVNTYQTARSRIKRFLDNFIFFLKLVGIFILIIAGVGIHGTLTAFLKEKEQTIAIMKTVGATNRHITLHFMLIVFLLSLIGTVMGILVGTVLQRGLAGLLADFLPPDLRLSIVWSGVFENIVIGFSVVAMFTFIPLYRLREMRPVMILREETPRSAKRWPLYASGAMFALFFFSLIFWHMQDFRFGLYFVAGVGGLILITYLCTHLMLWILKGWKSRQLVVRQAIKGLFRQGGATKTIIITLTASLSVIFSIYLIEKNLDATFIRSYPEGAPNMIILDIQPSQKEAFTQMLDQKVRFYPLIRARILAINGETIKHDSERRRRRDNLSRVFNLTYQDSLLEYEKIIKGKGLFRKDWTEPQVSILDIVGDMRKMGIGDTIRFKIQGVPLEARISSIRTRIKESLTPFFYFVLQEKTLGAAPQTVFSTLRMENIKIGPLQTRIVNRFPNISVIDVSSAVQVFGRLLKRLSKIIRGFSILSMAAGVLILISAVFATRAQRITESVYYKILGAKKTFVFRVFTLENIFIGLLSGFLALIVSQLVAFWVCRSVFEIPYHLYLTSCLLMIGATLLLIITIGVISTKSILERKPITYLREQPDG